MTDLILGTAEFGPKPYGEGVQVPPSMSEIIRILNLAYEGGIRVLDCAEGYETETLEPYFGGFGRINKNRNQRQTNRYYHYQPGENPIDTIFASVYDFEQLASYSIVPFNINNPLFATRVLNDPNRTIVRSVFDRGRLLKQGFTIKDCLSFVYRHKPQDVIVGVNSVKELEEILLAWESLK